METKKGTQLFSQGFSQTAGDGRKVLRPLFLQDAINRRVFLGGSAGGLGYAALASLMQPDVARAAAAAFHLGGLDEHQPGPAGGEAAVVHQVPVGHVAMHRGILVHRGDDDAVLERGAADGDRREEKRLGHGNSDT